jgi:uncharacterized protein YjbJ (UPF0337 family)
MTDDLRNDRNRPLDDDETLGEAGAKNRVKGAGDKLSGRVRNALGALAGDDSQQASGKAQELKGRAKDALGRAQQNLDRTLNNDRKR